ncbi:MAG TPA: putative peptidoglycan glycosyltransferase FtsW [Candidatus Saccharimonadales bacterium]|nr:putative peptidoglycan glycosyltransferase FtsW [Candidatus Saccharimonadales bacterium]
MRLFNSVPTVGDDQQVRRHRPDYWLVIIALFLVVIGLTVVYAITPALSATSGGSGAHYVSRQLLAIGLSIVAFLTTARIPLRIWHKWQVPLLVVAATGTLIALVTPVIAQYPAHRWIRLGGFSLQSVEVLKFALLIWLASFLTGRARQGMLADGKLTLRPLLMVLVVVGVVVAGVQSDLGSTGVIVAMMAAMAFIAGLPLRKVLLIGGIVAIGLVLAVSAIPYRRERLFTFLHPESNCLTTGYQACQALIAVGSGGISGLGLGRSVQAYGYLPEAQNDSIFAIYAEKFGFLGVMVLLGLFGALFARLRIVIERTQDMFSRLVVAGILAWFSTQMIINVGAMVGLLPLKGITLPFVSYGGTSVLFVGAALGLVFQISHYTSFSARNVQKSSNGQSRTNNENSNDRRRVGRAYHPDSSSRT